jgi:hypothetical protein
MEEAGPYLTSPHSKKSIQPTPRRSETSRIRLVVAQVQVGGEEQDGREHHGEGLEGTGMLGGNECC